MFMSVRDWPSCVPTEEVRVSRVVHFEIQADDVERTKTFYTAVFDWSSSSPVSSSSASSFGTWRRGPRALRPGPGRS